MAIKSFLLLGQTLVQVYVYGLKIVFVNFEKFNVLKAYIIAITDGVYKVYYLHESLITKFIT